MTSEMAVFGGARNTTIAPTAILRGPRPDNNGYCVDTAPARSGSPYLMGRGRIAVSWLAVVDSWS
jgi:hypothetical protein